MNSEVETKRAFLIVILSEEKAIQDKPIEELCAGMTFAEILREADELDAFWPETENLYHRVRALIFLYFLHRFEIPKRIGSGESFRSFSENLVTPCPIPREAHRALQNRNYAEGIQILLANGMRARINQTLSTGLASAYHGLALQNLADQVKRSVRSEVGNQWMFRIGHPDDYPLKIHPSLVDSQKGMGLGSWLMEETAVRMDLSHSCWSDIFFLGMDRPAFAKVINTSVDLVVRGHNKEPSPPCLSALRVIDRPIIRLVSLDLETEAEIEELSELFDFGKDYLGLLKAALIASGLIPSGLEGSKAPLEDLLHSLVGPGRGLELVSWVKDIPKGSRLAVSTNLLGGLISVCMRATSQSAHLEGALSEEERRIVASRAILGEWLGGSGGGWQDSGGVWPGIKLIEGCWEDGEIAQPVLTSNGESGGQFSTSSMGALLPRHTRLDPEIIQQDALQGLENSLILVHGGMAANVGPILEMVTERYLLRSEPEWQARQRSLNFTNQMLASLKAGDIKKLGELTTQHFFGPLKIVIPWASNAFTEALIDDVSRELEKLEVNESLRSTFSFTEKEFKAGNIFWGFWMLGGMSGGGMGFIVNPKYHEQAKEIISGILQRLKEQFETALPFAMNPVIYDFQINKEGTSSTAIPVDQLPRGRREIEFLREYFRFRLPQLMRSTPKDRTFVETEDLYMVERMGKKHSETFLSALLPEMESRESKATNRENTSLESYLQRYGFDREAHEQIRDDLRRGKLGLAQNRLHPKTRIEDISADSLVRCDGNEAAKRLGEAAISSGECAIVTLAAGAGSRWTKGAGVVKALHPFAPFDNGFNSFLDIHLAKSRKVSREHGIRLPHVITTSYLTHPAISAWAQKHSGDQLRSIEFHLSEGKSIGLRFVPTQKDLHYAWYEQPQEKLDEQAEKMRDSVRQSLMRWAIDKGEASDYRDNIATQCLHPVGHWYEIPNLLLNGTLRHLLQLNPQLKYLLVHNIDTLGVTLDAEILGKHISSGSSLSFEVMQRCFADVGGGLAKVNGQMRLVEGFALPQEDDEFKLSYYNTLTNWITLDALLEVFSLTRDDFSGSDEDFAARAPNILRAIRTVAQEMPTYITLKDAKKRWGRGQEDVFPVLQFERLWGDMSAYLLHSDAQALQFILVDRNRGMQLKDPDELDAINTEGFLHFVEKLT